MISLAFAQPDPSERLDLRACFNEEFFLKIRAGQYCRRLFPEFSDRQYWDNIIHTDFQKKSAEHCIALADQALNLPIPECRFNGYVRFTIDGNRNVYEQEYFARRNRLGYLVVAMCITGNKDKYFSTIIDYIWAIMEESFWTVPAHAAYTKLPDGKTDPIPHPRTRYKIALFSAVTGAVLAQTWQMLGDEIKSFSPHLYELMHKDISKRALLSILDEQMDMDHPFIHGYNNWTPWCAHSMLITAVCMIEYPLLMEKIMRRLVEINARFVDNYDADGYCDEGATYWSKSAAELARTILIIDQMIPGACNEIFTNRQFVNMMEFPANMKMSPTHNLTFADGGIGVGSYSATLFYRLGRKTGSPKLLQAAVDETNSKMNVRMSGGGVGEYLRNELENITFPMSFDDIKQEHLQPPYITEYKNRLAIFHIGNGISASLKAGTNGENHNHNDLGHFCLYSDGKPIIIDFGQPEYTRQNFAAETRWQIIFNNANGHNAPLFNNAGQAYGKEYRSTLTVNSNLQGTFSGIADLSLAYPTEVGVERFTRVLTVTPTGITVTDAFKLKTPEDATITLFSPERFQRTNKGILLGNILFSTDNVDSVKADIWQCKDKNISTRWGKELTRIILKTKSNNYSLKFHKELRK
ncbi:MAG: heparinase II/III family protein [Victivallales bacterium]|nr:heparinase II/III family protein [Victivallales bacterium]